MKLCSDMRKLEVELPIDVYRSESELKMLLAMGLFDLGKTSPEEAAIIAGVSKPEFLESVEEYDSNADL